MAIHLEISALDLPFIFTRHVAITVAKSKEDTICFPSLLERRLSARSQKSNVRTAAKSPNVSMKTKTLPLDEDPFPL